MKLLSHAAAVLTGIFLTALLLTLRATLPLLGIPVSAVSLVRMLLPAIILLGAIILTADALIRKDKAWIQFSGRSKTVLAFISFILTMAICTVDLLTSFIPFLILPGLLAISVMLWNHPRILGSLSVLAVLLLLAGQLLLQKALTVEFISILGFGLLLSFFGSELVRRNLAPTEARLKSLEAENQELWNLSYRDSLTGLFNRRYMQQTTSHIFARAVRYREQLHVLMLDIDHFKKVNDKLGHAVGDEVLKAVSATIQSCIRSSDVAARYGGEEFIIFIVQANSELTQFIANRIRDGVAALNIPGVPWPVTISIGVAGLQDGDSQESLIERADKFLYTSKHQGRNRVSGF